MLCTCICLARHLLLTNRYFQSINTPMRKSVSTSIEQHRGHMKNGGVYLLIQVEYLFMTQFIIHLTTILHHLPPTSYLVGNPILNHNSILHILYPIFFNVRKASLVACAIGRISSKDLEMVSFSFIELLIVAPLTAFSSPSVVNVSVRIGQARHTDRQWHRSLHHHQWRLTVTSIFYRTFTTGHRIRNWG